MLTSPSGELLPSDLLVLVLAQLSLVRNIKGVKRTCRALRDAAPAAEQAHRRVCFEHNEPVKCVAAAPDGRVITGSKDRTVKVWLNGVCERTGTEFCWRCKAVAAGAHRRCRSSSCARR